MKVFDLDMQRFFYDLDNHDKFKDMYVENLDIDAKEFIPEVEKVIRPDGPYKIGGMGSYALDQNRLNRQTVATEPKDKMSIGNPNPYPDVVNVDFYTGKVYGNNIENLTVSFPGFNSYEKFVKPLEQGGGGATIKNSSQQKATLPKWLYDQHMAGKKIT